jgi:TonB family protein
MSRSSDILSQMQQRRAERKKPKVNSTLKKTSIGNNQISGIAAAQENKPPPITMQKTGGRNSVAMTFSIGLHVAIAILLGIFYIKERIIPPHEQFAGDFVPSEINQRERSTVKVRDRVKFDTQQKIEAPVQRAPITNANIPQKPGDIPLLSTTDTNFAPVDPGLGEGPRINVIKRGVRRPIQSPQTSIAPPIVRPRPTDPNPDLSNPSKPIDSTTFEVPDVDTTQAETKDPKAKYAPKPIYPKNAKRAEKEGKVMLQATIGIDGIPKDIVAVTKLGFGFEEAAIAALKKWKFIPAKKKGKDVERRINIPIEFKLED